LIALHLLTVYASHMTAVRLIPVLTSLACQKDYTHKYLKTNYSVNLPKLSLNAKHHSSKVDNGSVV